MREQDTTVRSYVNDYKEKTIKKYNKSKFYTILKLSLIVAVFFVFMAIVWEELILGIYFTIIGFFGTFAILSVFFFVEQLYFKIFNKRNRKKQS